MQLKFLRKKFKLLDIAEEKKNASTCANKPQVEKI